MKKNTESLYFISDRHGSGDHSPSHRRGCCRAATVECLSCAAGMTQEQFQECYSELLALHKCKYITRGAQCNMSELALQQCNDGNKPQLSPQDDPNMRFRKGDDRPKLAVNNNDNRSGYIWKIIAIFVVLFLIGGGIIYLLIQKS